jgi:hypothetical protein
VAAAGISRAPVVFRVDRLGEDDRSLGAELLDEQMIARGEVDVVARVTAGGGTHVLRVEGVLEREHDAIHRHRLEIGMAPVHLVELGRALERVRELAEHLAHGGRAERKRPRGRVPIEVARQVTERSPRILRVASAFTCPAFGLPTIIPNCCCTSGSEAVASMRPYSSAGPLYLSTSGSTAEALTVSVGKRNRSVARTAPVASGTGPRLP